MMEENEPVYEKKNCNETYLHDQWLNKNNYNRFEIFKGFILFSWETDSLSITFKSPQHLGGKIYYYLYYIYNVLN